MSIIFQNTAFYSPNYSFQYSNDFFKRQEMSESRIIIKNLVYIIGFSYELLQLESKLKSFEYFGQYGKIVKFAINRKKQYNSDNPLGPSYTCYITYSTEAESSLAILSLDNFIIDNHVLRANYGTTKYCNNFINNLKCTNKDCIFFHKIANPKNIVSRKQMNTDKELFDKQRLMAIELSEILTNKKYKELYKLKNIKTIFPNGFDVYKRDLVIRYIQQRNLGICLNLDLSELTIVKRKIEQNSKKLNLINNENNKSSNKQENIEDDTGQIKVKSNAQILIKYYLDAKKQLNYLYKSTSKSRFNFAKPNSVNNENSQIIPNQFNDFLTQLFVNHSTTLYENQNNMSYYYFSLKSTSLDSSDSWNSLILTSKKWNEINGINGIKEEENKNKFNTY